MEKVKYSIRKIYQDGGESRRIGGRSNPSVPLKGAYVLVQLPGESKARVAIIEDLFSDSDAFFATMVKSSAYSISPGTAVYDEDGKLVSATVTWADGSTGQVQYNYLDDNGSYELNATKEAGGTLPVTYKDVTIKSKNKDIQENSIITAGKGCCVELTITDREPYTLTSDLQSYNMSCTVLSISAPRQALLPGMAVLFMDEYLDSFGNPASGIKMGIISSYIEATMALTCRMVTRWESVGIGNIIMSKETATTSENNTRHPELVVFTPQLLPLIDGDGIFVKSPDSAIFVKQTYTPKTITGGNIYIQSNEPSDPDCVWIDTNGINLIIE